MFDSAEWVSYSLAPSSRYCFTVGLEGWAFYRIKDSQFGGWKDWFPAWLQNLLGNVITFNALYEKIVDAVDAEDLIAQVYWYGRIANLFIDFEPIPVDDLDLDDDIYLADIGGLESSIASSPYRKSLLSSQKKPRVQGWFSSTSNFVIGFVNSSFGEHAPNASICHTNITHVID